MPKSYSIMIVEDERIAAEDIRRRLVSWGYAVTAVVATGEEAILSAARFHPDLVLMDIHLRGAMDGVEAAERIQKNASVPVIYASAHSDIDTLRRARISGPFSIINKPYDDTEIRAAVELALTRHIYQRKIEELETRYSHLLGLLKKPSLQAPENLLPAAPPDNRKTIADIIDIEEGSPLNTLRHCVGSLNATELTVEQRTILEKAEHSLRSIEGFMDRVA
jgi:CheY-like chemotaxis protein